MADVEKVTKETIEKGGILALLYFDIHGKDKEKLVDIGAGFIQQILKEAGVIYALGEVDNPFEQNDLFSTSVNLKVLFKDFISLSSLCSKYSPFSVEIIRPDKISLAIDQAHDLLMDIAATNFEYKKYIIEKLADDSELKSYKDSFENKLLMGKKMRESKQGEVNG